MLILHLLHVHVAKNGNFLHIEVAGWRSILTSASAQCCWHSNICFMRHVRCPSALDLILVMKSLSFAILHTLPDPRYIILTASL